MSADDMIRVHATVRVEIELTESAWGSDCQLSQVYSQAKRDALSRIQNNLALGARVIRIVSVDAVLVPEGSR